MEVIYIFYSFIVLLIIFFIEVICESLKVESKFRPSNILETIRIRIEKFFIDVGKIFAWISSLINYDILETSFKKLSRPTVSIMASWLLVFKGYYQYISTTLTLRKGQVYLTSFIIFGITSGVLIYYFFDYITNEIAFILTVLASMGGTYYIVFLKGKGNKGDVISIWILIISLIALYFYWTPISAYFVKWNAELEAACQANPECMAKRAALDAKYK